MISIHIPKRMVCIAFSRHEREANASLTHLPEKHVIEISRSVGVMNVSFASAWVSTCQEIKIIGFENHTVWTIRIYVLVSLSLANENSVLRLRYRGLHRFSNLNTDQDLATRLGAHDYFCLSDVIHLTSQIALAVKLDV